MTLAPLVLLVFRLEAVIHIELDRMRRHTEFRDFFHLEFDVGVDVRVGADLEYLCAHHEE